MRVKLIGSAGPVIGREFDLDQPVTTIGRRDENDIVIKDPTVSRKHAEVRQEGETLILSDKESTSGTLVNGTQIEGEHALRDGDIIVIGGSATFAVQIQPAEDATIAFSRERLGDFPASSPAHPQASTAAAYQDAGHTGVMPPAETPAHDRSGWQSPAEPARPAPYNTPPQSWQQPSVPPHQEPPRASDWPVPPPPADEQPWSPPAPPRAEPPAFGGESGWGSPPDPRQQHSAAPPSPPLAAPLSFSDQQPSAPPLPPLNIGAPPPSQSPGDYGQPWGGQQPSSTPPNLGPAQQPYGVPQAPQIGQGQGAQPFMAPPPAPQRRSRRGLIIGLTLLLILIVAAMVVIALVLYNQFA